MSKASTPTRVSLDIYAEPCDASALRQINVDRGGAPMTLEQLAELLDALLRLREGEAHRHRALEQSGLCRRDVHLPGCVLSSITIAGRIKYNQAQRWPIPIDWADNRAEWSALLAAWILANGGDADALAALDERSAQPLIEAWAAAIDIDFATLAVETASLLAYGNPPDTTGTPNVFDPIHPDHAAVLILLCKEIGGTPEYWLGLGPTHTPESQVAWLLRSLGERNAARSAAIKPDAIDPKDPKVTARLNWRKVTDKLCPEDDA